MDSNNVLGNSVTVANTFEDSTITGGEQTIYGLSEPVTINDSVELPNFINFYDVDVSEDSLTLTLVNNSDAADLILPEERFDRYYIEFDDSTVTSASLDGSEELNEFANVEVLEPGFILEPVDAFGTGISIPVEFESGGLLVEFGAGTDLTNLGVSANINFTSEPIPEPTSVLGDAVTVANTFEDSAITGGEQTIYGLSEPATINDAVELPNFINFYDVDVSEDSLTLTLVNNSDAADLILPAERFDRYYIEFDESTITSANLDGSEELNEFANVEVLEPGFVLEPVDLFETGISVPVEFENGGLLVEFGEGTDLTNLGVSAKVNFTSEPVLEPSIESLMDTSFIRFQSTVTPGAYIYVTETEAESIRNDFADSFIEEGVAFNAAIAPDDSLIALTRLQSVSTPGSYIFVGDEELASIQSNPELDSEFIEEGIAFYALAGGTDIGIQFNRFQNLSNNTFLFAGSEESAFINGDADFAAAFLDQGTAFAAF